MSRPYYCQNVETTTKRGALKPLVYIFNAILRLEYWPKSLNLAQIIMISKHAKNPLDVSSYGPISLLPIISKVMEKLILKKNHLAERSCDIDGKFQVTTVLEFL
jgi:hypothetical protein